MAATAIKSVMRFIVFSPLIQIRVAVQRKATSLPQPLPLEIQDSIELQSNFCLGGFAKNFHLVFADEPSKPEIEQLRRSIYRHFEICERHLAAAAQDIPDSSRHFAGLSFRAHFWLHPCV